ncbi:polysaccharide biosynthesis C-terminal domain-containing protein [Providencia rettgeri]|uniref:oligosaccharide flippase family protein n=1 Tax=Providencia sp. PROV021 TaxID=2949756 RepID=UPI0018A05F61|nr:polysaccharide biosynthesis C-terminal domain-containing protein [Providencia rettgeri]
MNKLKNIFLYSGEKYLIVISSFITTVILSRKISPDIFGNIILLQSFVILFSIVTLLSMDSIFIKSLSINKTVSTERTILFLKIFFSILAFIIYLFFIYLFEFKIDTNHAIILGLPILFSFSTYVEINLMASKKIYKLSTFNIIIYASIFIVKCVFLYYYQLNISLICLLLILDQIVSRIFVIFYGVLIEKNINKKVLKVYKTTVIKSLFFLKKGYPLIISSLFLVGYVRTNQIIIGYYLSPSDVTYFSLPIKIIDGISIIITTYVSAIFPYLVHDLKIKNSSDVALNYFGKIIQSGIILSVITYIFSEEIIYTIFGEQYGKSVPVMRIYSIAIIFNFIFIASGRWLIAKNKIKLAAQRNIYAFFFNLIFSLVMVPLIGINGAAIASLIAWFFSGYLIFLYSDKWLFLKITSSIIIFKVNVK